MKSPGVYRIFNKVTKRSYVGSSSKDWANRRNGHVCLLRKGVHPSKKMQDDWNTHGMESFVFFCVCECPADKVLDFEKAAAEEFKVFDPEKGYNKNPIAGNRFRGGRPEGTNKVKFTRMVSPNQAERILQYLELDNGDILFVERGKNSGLAAKSPDGKRYMTMCKPSVHDSDYYDEVAADSDARDGVGPISQPTEVSILRARIIQLEKKIKEYENMYA